MTFYRVAAIIAVCVTCAALLAGLFICNTADAKFMCLGTALACSMASILFIAKIED